MAEPVVVMEARTTRRSGRRSVDLGLARMGEQGALAVVLLVLALRLQVAEFGIVTLLVSFQSIAVTASDYGLGLAVLGAAPGIPISRDLLARCRRRNAAVLAFGAVAGLGASLLGASATVAVVLCLCGILWAVSAEAYIRKAAALRLGLVRRVASVEVAGSAALLGIVVAFAFDQRALVVLAVAFIVKSAIEVLAFPEVVASTFERDGLRVVPGWICVSQVLAYATSNVDYAIVAVLLGSRSLGLYGLAFRAASILPVQLNAVVQRIGTLDLAGTDRLRRSAVVERLVRLLLIVGIVAGVAGALCTPLVGPVLGHRWADAAPLMVPLFLAVPWRLLLPLIGIGAIVDGRTRRLCAVELARLGITATALLLAAQIGVGAVATVGALVIVAASTYLLGWSSMRLDGAPRRLLLASALTGAAAIAALGAWT